MYGTWAFVVDVYRIVNYENLLNFRTLLKYLDMSRLPKRKKSINVHMYKCSYNQSDFVFESSVKSPTRKKNVRQGSI